MGNPSIIMATYLTMATYLIMATCYGDMFGYGNILWRHIKVWRHIMATYSGMATYHGDILGHLLKSAMRVYKEPKTLTHAQFLKLQKYYLYFSLFLQTKIINQKLIQNYNASLLTQKQENYSERDYRSLVSYCGLV